MACVNIAKISSALFASIYVKIFLFSLLLFLFFPTIPQIEILRFSPINQKPITDIESNILTKWELLMKITNTNFFPIKFNNLTINASVKKVKIAYGFIEDLNLKMRDIRTYSVPIFVPIYHNRNYTNMYNECLNSSVLKMDICLLGEIMLSLTSSIFLGTSFNKEIDCFNKITSA
jgi:hypothetical protein